MALIVPGAELGIHFSVEKYEQISVMNEGQFPGCFYNSMKAGCNFIELKIPHPPPPPLADLPFREDLNRLRAGNHRWEDLFYSRIRRARDRLDTWNSEYWAAEMSGVTPGIPAFNTPSLPIRPRKTKRLSEEENATVSDSSNKLSSVTDANMQRAEDASARGSVPGEPNELKGPGDASRSKGKGNVDPVDQKAEKKRITAKTKADLEERRIPAFRIGGTSIPPCSAVQTAVDIPQPLLPRAPFLAPLTRSALEFSKRMPTSFPHVDLVMPLSNAAPQHKATLISLIGGVRVNLPNPDRLSIFELPFFDWASDIISVISTGYRIIGSYEAEVQRREDKIKTLASRFDVDAAWQKVGHQMHRADSWEATASENQQNLNDLFDHASALKEERPRLEEEVKKRDEGEYVVHVESFSADSLGDDTLFPTPSPPPAGPPPHVASQVSEGISEHGSSLPS
ncbi:hypothetical protein AALP_AA7G104700 [Arabis alpina]|uniref:Uncharacterized protein n=1 Tax=Arabis alpina TaxID=50452 RepID=A0A087GH66_ARAAL|nr:hypothetical protein AALP_AA7G104700 [Arabis alpina]